VLLGAQVAEAQPALPALPWPSASGWDAAVSGAYTRVGSADRGYLNAQVDAAYVTPGMGVGIRLHLNRKQRFSFAAEPFAVRVREGVTVVAADDATPPETYWIDQPVTLSWTKRFGRWGLATSWSLLRQGASRAEPRLVDAGSDVFFVRFATLAARQTRVLGNVIAQYHRGPWYLQGGVLSVPGLRRGDQGFDREYEPVPQPYAGFGWQAAALHLGGFVDTKRVSATYRQRIGRLRLGDVPPVQSALTYQRGLDAFAFDRLRLSLTVPLSRYVQGRVVLDKVWSAHRTIRERDFERWQEAGVFGDGEALYGMLPHDAAWAGVRLTIPSRRPWPLKVVETDFYQEHLFLVRRARYARDPVGRVEVRNTTPEPLDVQLRVEHRGAELYRSEVVTLPGRATRSLPLFLYLPSALTATSGMPVPFEVTAVVGAEERMLAQWPVTVYGPNAWSGRTWELEYFLTPAADSVRQRAEHLYAQNRPVSSGTAVAQFEHLKAFLTALGNGVVYLPDPTTTDRVDHVQYARETLRRGGGDCEDLTVLLASSLMAVGVHTAVVDLRPRREEGLPAAAGAYGHVFLLVDTGIAATALEALGLTEFQGLTRMSPAGTPTLWIPLEPTVLDEGFERAFDVGVRQYYEAVILKDGMARGDVQVYDF
jgi:hypothetical protein